MKSEMNDNSASPNKLKLSDYITCSFDKNTKYLTQVSHKWDLKEYEPYRFLDANKSKIVVCHNINTKMDFIDIYKSPRNALYDTACCMKVLNQGCGMKLYPWHVIDSIYCLKYQLSKILYQDNKCIGVIRQLDKNNPSAYLPWFFFRIAENVFDWHIPEKEVPFKYNILQMKPNNGSFISSSMNHMNFDRKRALIRWVINNWK